MRRAIDAVRTSTLSISKASTEFEIPERTLRRHVDKSQHPARAHDYQLYRKLQREEKVFNKKLKKKLRNRLECETTQTSFERSAGAQPGPLMPVQADPSWMVRAPKMSGAVALSQATFSASTECACRESKKSSMLSFKVAADAPLSPTATLIDSIDDDEFLDILVAVEAAGVGLEEDTRFEAEGLTPGPKTVNTHIDDFNTHDDPGSDDPDLQELGSDLWLSEFSFEANHTYVAYCANVQLC